MFGFCKRTRMFSTAAIFVAAFLAGFLAPSSQADVGYVGDTRYTLEKVSQGRFIYPRAALRREIEGEVVLELTIGVDGTVVDAFVLQASPPNRFEKNALKWARSWLYEPLIVDGKAVQVEKVRVPVRYRLRKVASL